jgi:hypothetical protein
MKDLKARAKSTKNLGRKHRGHWIWNDFLDMIPKVLTTKEQICELDYIKI